MSGTQMHSATVTITLSGACEDDSTPAADLTDEAAQRELISRSATFGTTEDIHPVAINALNAVKSAVISRWDHNDEGQPYRKPGVGSARVVVDLRGTAEVPGFPRVKVFHTDVSTNGELTEALNKAMFAMIDAAAGWLRDRKAATKPSKPADRPRISDGLPI